MINFIKSTLYWIGLGLLYTIRILSTGMTAGVIAFVLLGPLFGSYTHDALFLKGASVGFRYTGVWAGGLAIFLCLIKAHRKGQFLN